MSPQISVAELEDLDLSDPNVTRDYPMQAVMMAILARTMTALSLDKVGYIILRVIGEDGEVAFSVCTGEAQWKDQAVEGLKFMLKQVEESIAAGTGEKPN